jgi:integrase/recombinase XerD
MVEQRSDNGMSTETIILHPSAPVLPGLIAGAGERAAWRFLEFFTVNIRNKNTRAAYGQATGAFLRWCEERGITRIEDVKPVHVAGYIEQLQGSPSAPTVKQHLACIRMLFDWLVTGQVIATNPAHAVRGPRHSVIKGATTVMSSQEATAFLNSIDASHLVGLRDRAFIGVMVFAFARVSAVVGLQVEDYFPLKKRWWLRLREKGGKVNEMGCHHKLEGFLDAYIAAAGIADDKKGPLFRAAIGRTGKLSDRPMSRVDAWYMVQRRSKDTGLETAIGNHSFRAIGITDYLENGGDINIAKRMAGHSNVKTTELYDRRADEVSFSEIERVGI